MNTSKIHIDSTLLDRDPVEIRRRNRRIALIIVTFLITMTLLCAAYINWIGGANKGPMKPFHVHVVATNESIAIVPTAIEPAAIDTMSSGSTTI